MLAGWARGAFDDPAYLFEPWWPGTRAIAFVEDGRVRLQADELADMLGAFPELAALPAQVAASDAVLDGVVLVLDGSGRPDPVLLRARLSGREAARGEGRAAFVGTDLLAAGGARVSRLPFVRRRERLAAVLATTEWCTASRGYPGEGRMLAIAAAELGFRALSAHRLDAPYRAGPAGDAWLRVPLDEQPSAEPPVERPLPSIVAVFRRLPLDHDG